MRKGNKGILCYLLTVVLFFSGFLVNSVEASAKSQKKILKSYTKILSKQKFLNEGQNSERPYFAIADLNNDGKPELLIRESFHILSNTYYYTYKKGKVVKIKGPAGDESYPVYGLLYLMPKRKTYAFYRGGPASDDEKLGGFMPYTVIEYRIKGKKIKAVNNAAWYKFTSGRNIYYLNGKKCRAKAFKKIYKSLGNEISFVPNSSRYRNNL